MRRAMLIVVTLCVFDTAPLDAQAAYRVGIGRGDITPEEPIWMAGYGNRNKPSTGVDQPLHVKALALQHNEASPLVLITADIIGFSREVAEEIAGHIQEKFKLPRENILLVGSHTHTGPVIGKNLRGMFDLNEKDVDVIRRYTKTLIDRSVTAASDALTKLEPAKLSFG